MKPMRKLSRRSFLATVSGGAAFALAGCATPREETTPYDPLEDAAPRERGRLEPGGEERARGCTDGDSGRYHDRPGHGRTCEFGGTRRRPPRRD
jgi:hypothetical protein